MTREEKKELINSSPVVGYWNRFGGVEVRKIEHTPDGIMFYIKANVQCSEPTYHIRKVSEQYSNDGAHSDNVKIYNHRLYIRDCLRV